MATPLTDENAEKFLQPIVDNVLEQVRGILSPLQTEVAALKALAPVAPATPTPVDATKAKIPDGVDITDPKSIEAHRAKLVAQSVDWNDPVAVAAYHDTLTAAVAPVEPPTAEAVSEEVAVAKAALAAAEARVVAAERRSNQGNAGDVVTSAMKSAASFQSLDTGHAIGDLLNTLVGRTPKGA